MSTDEQSGQPTIKALLDSLNDEFLTRSHNSLNISFKQMLAYVDKIQESIPAGDINILLKAYRTMAEMFYAQYELLLLEEIVKQRDVKQSANAALEYINGLKDAHSAKLILQEAVPLLVADRDQAAIEYQKLLENFPERLQKALNKLRNEWQRLDSITGASQALVKDEKLNRVIKIVVEVAAHSVGVDLERIVIVPSTAFSIIFFNYLENLAILTVPIYSVQSPWEWSIFWHELAGYKIRQLEKSSALDDVRKKLIATHNLSKIMDKGRLMTLLNSITLDNQFGRNYLIELFSRERVDLSDLGSFEHQFERMLINLPSAEKFQLYDQIKAQGWCVDWFKELFEDAWSVLAFGELFLEFFKDILGRNSAKDKRHPPLEVRLSVAKELLKLLNPQSKVSNDPSLIEQFAAQQVLKFISLLMAGARKFESPDELLQPISPQIMVQNIRDWLFVKVKGEVRQSIADWSGKFLSAANPVLQAKNSSQKFLDAFSDPELETLLLELDKYETGQVKPVYKALLKDKDYKQLLELSFSFVDFGVSTVTDVYYKTKKVFDIADLSSVPSEVVGGNVAYESGSGTKNTTIQFWNVAAAPGFTIAP